VLGFGGWRVLQGSITLGTFTMFLYFLAMLTWPMIGMGVVVNITQRGVASLGRINELMGQRPEIADNALTRHRHQRVQGSIEWRNVSVQYPRASSPALKGVSLRVPKGESLALIGPVGSGKSTLANLVPRLLEPTDGEVLVDGVDVRQLPLAMLRRSVGHVPQETFLFSRTIFRNICLGKSAAREEEVQAAAAAAMLNTEGDSFPEGLETLVGERGITLSGGQKQRVALARAMIRDPRILVLDDATSSVDAETEHELLMGIRREMLGRTVLIVTHRVSTARLVDRIVVLDAGRISDEGSHRELLARGGLYARMHDRQLIEEELSRP
jgi:ATP-binding cassette subfamily B protein